MAEPPAETAARVAADRYRPLLHQPDPALAQLVRLAGRMFQVPVALISLLEGERLRCLA
jgi:hypothetical protein